MKSFNTLFGLVMWGVLMASSGCKVIEQAEKISIRKRSSQFLLQQLKNNEFSYEWLSAKVNTQAVIDNKKVEIDIKMRIRKDSAIWLSVSAVLGIEVARILITEDSLKFMNRIDKTYYDGSLDYLDRLAPVDINYTILQAIITGNNSNIPDKNESDDKPERYRSSVHDDQYLLSTLRKRKYKKSFEGKKQPDEIVYRIWLNPLTYKIVRAEINNFKDDKMVLADYSMFELIEGKPFPHKMHINMQAHQKITVDLDYSKVVLNVPQTLPYSVPEKYDLIY